MKAQDADEALWRDWEAHYRDLRLDPQRISRDGAPEPRRYWSESCRLLVVMRETNDFPDGDIRSLMRSGPHFELWHNVARWSAGLLDGFPPFEEVSGQARMKDTLQRIAAINLKKESGGASADLDTIHAFAARDRDLLLRQIRDLSPTLILACGTIAALTWLLDIDHRPGATPWVRDAGLQNVIVIPWRHPSRTKGVEKAYRQLADAMAGRTSAPSS